MSLSVYSHEDVDGKDNSINSIQQKDGQNSSKNSNSFIFNLTTNVNMVCIFYT